MKKSFNWDRINDIFWIAYVLHLAGLAAIRFWFHFNADYTEIGIWQCVVIMWVCIWKGAEARHKYFSALWKDLCDDMLEAMKIAREKYEREHTEGKSVKINTSVTEEEYAQKHG